MFKKQIEDQNLRIMSEEAFKHDLSEGSLNLESPGITLRKQYICDNIKTVDLKRRRIDFTISTTSVDRMGDTISVDGWNLKNFRNNPVVLFAHNSRQPPIGKALSVKKSDGKLVARAEFMDKEMNEFAFSIFQMFEKGFMRATSVGFRPIQMAFSEDEKRKGEFFMPIDFEKQELLEFSAVPVPANPDALMDAKDFGIDLAPLNKWAHEVLDNWSEDSIEQFSKKSLEDLEAVTSESKPKHYRLTGDKQLTLLEKNLERQKSQEEEETPTKESIMPDDDFGFDDEAAADSIHEKDEEYNETGGIENETIKDIIDAASKAALESVKEVLESAKDIEGVESIEISPMEISVKEVIEDSDEEILVKDTFEDAVRLTIESLDDFSDNVKELKALASTRHGNRLVKNFAESLAEFAETLYEDVLEIKLAPEEEEKAEVIEEQEETSAKETFVEEKADGEPMIEVTPDLVKNVLKELLPEIVKGTMEESLNRMKGKVD